MMFRLVSSFDMYLSHDYRDPIRHFESNMYGKTAEAPRWEICVREVIDYLGIPLATAFIDTHFSTEDREKAIEMMADFKKGMESLLLEAEWMDDDTRTAALKKLESMRYKMGLVECQVIKLAQPLPLF
ncbi:hypothetical protein COOONC_24508 [Cooperia oncophora]